MILKDVRLAFRAAFINLRQNFNGYDTKSFNNASRYLIAILTVVIPRRFKYREVKFGNGVGADVRVSLSEVVDEHSPPFEAEQTRMAFINESVVIRRLHLRQELFGGRVRRFDGF